MSTEPKDPIFRYSEKALAKMSQHQVRPAPKNYALFFAYAASQPSELVRELDRIYSTVPAVTEEILDELYTQFLSEVQSRTVKSSVDSAKKILTEMMMSVAHLSGSTSAVSQEITRKLEVLEDAPTEDVLKDFANTIIESARVLKQSSDQVADKLATSQRQIADLKEDLAKASAESERDFLTGVFNRKAFDKRLTEGLQEAKEKDQQLSLLMMDIDHFKNFNDSFGHEIGDQVLKIVARTLTDSVKGMDMVARFGGEEFVVILPKTPIGGAMIVADAIRKAIAGREMKRRDTGENYGVITVSVGVACYRHGSDNPAALLKRADEALYRSKKGGRNRVTQENLSEEVR